MIVKTHRATNSILSSATSAAIQRAADFAMSARQASLLSSLFEDPDVAMLVLSALPEWPASHRVEEHGQQVLEW